MHFLFAALGVHVNLEISCNCLKRKRLEQGMALGLNSFQNKSKLHTLDQAESPNLRKHLFRRSELAKENTTD